jgi:hypothetical protein
MNTQLQMVPQPQTEPTQPQLSIPRWNPSLKIAFRFWMIYLGLYCFASQIVISLFNATEMASDLPDPATVWPLRPVISWVGAHIFHVNAFPSPTFGGNSGTLDCMFGWVMTFCVLVTATVATVVWSLLDRHRENYAGLHKWFSLFVRFALAGQMIIYGVSKVIPVQMPYPSLTRLLQPFGTLSPMGALWASMGATPAYETFTGFAELTGGLLLIVPRTAIVGAVFSLAAMIQVFTTNMSYDVPAKRFAFHTLLLPCFLLAPEVPRLLRALLSRQEQLFRGIRANRIALAAQILLGLWIVGVAGNYAWGAWNIRGAGRPLPPLYGIWEVKQMSIDEQPRPPLLTDSDRWRRAIFDYPNRMAFQRIDDTFAAYGASVNLPERTLALTKSGDKNWKANFTFQQPAGDQLILDGRMDNHQVHMELQWVDRNSFVLVSRGFRWIQEAPFGRW